MPRPRKDNRLRLLVVADKPDSREYLLASLDPARFDLSTAEDAEQGLASIREQHPDAIILEHERDGLEVCRTLKSDPNSASIPVLFLSVQTDPAAQVEAFQAGADDYLVKPFDREVLLARLEVRMRAGQRQAEEGWDTQEQEALLDLTRMLASSLDLTDLLHLVAVRTASVLQVDRCALVRVEPKEGRATIMAASEDASVRDLDVSLEGYPEIEVVIESRRPLVVSRVEQHPGLKEILPVLESKGIGSIALFPMVCDDRVDGVMFLRSERFSHELSPRDMFFANAVAAAVALALRNVRIAYELRRTKQFLEAMIDTSVDAIIASDMKGTLILFNKGAELLTGYQAHEVIGKLNITQLYPSGVAFEVMQMLREDRYGGAGSLAATRKELVAKDGEVIPIQLTAWCVMEEGEEVATAGIFTDLRERLQIERKLSQAQEKLMHSEQQAVIAELAGATAHELNQPLTSVLGYAEMAKRKIGDAEAINRIVDTIISEAERMADIVRKIGRITKYETKSYVGGQRIVDLDRSSEPD